jgi:branched-chain amino acid transport system substrate-binding protein
MGNFAAQTLGLNKAVILAAESPYATGIQDVFKSEFERYGGEVAAVIEYPVGHTEFADGVRSALSHVPEAVYVADYAYEIGTIVKELRAQGFRGRILTTHAFSAPGVFADLGEAAEGVLLTRTIFDVNSEEPVVKGFVDAYKAKYGSAPDSFAAHGYDAIKVVEAALALGGATTPRDFWKGMRQVKITGASGVIQFDEKGDVSQFPRVYAIEKGELIDYEHVVEVRKKEILDRLEELKRQQAEAARRAAQGGGGS